MISRRRLLATTGAMIASAAVVSACGGSDSSSPGTSGSAGASPAAGTSTGAAPSAGDMNASGVLNLEQQIAFEHLDPQRVYVNNSTSIARLMYRPLMGWKENPADGTYELVPDLAAAAPTSPDGGKTWTFKIKTGLKFSDGSVIKAADVKYGVERSMDPAIPNGPVYAKLYLIGADKYTGPAKGAALASVEVPDDATITFKLKQVVGSWPQLATLLTFVPVPRAKDTGAAYDNMPVTNSSYKIQSYNTKSKLVLVKDPNWVKATDPLRSQNVTSIVCTMGLDESRVDNDLFSDTNGGTNVMFSDDPSAADIAKVTTPDVKSRTLFGSTIFVYYLAVQQNQAALKNEKVRQAILYARNPKASIQVAGGPLLLSKVQSFAPKALKGFEDVKDSFPDLGDEGNPDKAKQLLSEAGVSNLKITYAHSNSAKATAGAQALVSAMARAGITLIPQPIAADAFYTTVSTLKNKYDLVAGGWGYDIPDGSTIFPPIFQGGANLYDGTSNLAQLDDPAVNKLIESGLNAPTADAALPFWQQVNLQIVSRALVIPTYQIKVAQVLGSKVKGAYVSPVLGTMDVTNAYIST